MMGILVDFKIFYYLIFWLVRGEDYVLRMESFYGG